MATKQSGFDADPSNPQLFIETDTLPVSRTDEHDKSPTTHQKAQPALRQMLLTAKKLAEVNQS